MSDEILKFDEFESVSETDWKQKILMDLKGNPLPRPIKSDFNFDPFLTENKGDHFALNVKSGWKIACSFNIEDNKLLNDQILKALQLDVSVVHVYPHHNLKQQEYLANVHTELINIHESEPSIIINLSNNFSLDLRQWMASDETLLFCNASQDFILNIAALRAIRSYLEASQKEFTIYLRPNYTLMNKDLDLALIEKTLIGIAGAIGNADIIELAKIESNTKENYGRIATMIQHLLIYESRLGQVADPSAGSYVIEQITQKLLQQIREPAL